MIHAQEMEPYYAVIRCSDREIEALFLDEDEAVTWLRRAEGRSRDDFKVERIHVIFGSVSGSPGGSRTRGG